MTQTIEGTDVTEAAVRARVDRLLTEHADDDMTSFLGAQFDAGLARMDYPVGHGGLDAEPKLQEIVDEALEAAGRRYAWNRNPMGIGMCGPTIVARGTDEQRARFLRPIFTAEELWCQLFSEPGAGSDVAGLATRAERDGDEWIVNGSKIWTSLAHRARWGLLLARTDPDAPKHAGVTMMAIDMKAPGVTVNPLRGITGDSHFNEVFFDDVFVPDSDVVGDVNRGWLVARATLGNERISIGGGSGGASGFTPDHLIKLLDASPQAVNYVRRAGECIAETHTLRLLNLRRASRAIAGAEPGPEGNVTKLLVAEAGQRITELGMELAGSAAVVGQAPKLLRSYLGNRAMTIAGGTSEITRNTIAERILGLPRDPLLK